MVEFSILVLKAQVSYIENEFYFGGLDLSYGSAEEQMLRLFIKKQAKWIL